MSVKLFVNFFSFLFLLIKQTKIISKWKKIFYCKVNKLKKEIGNGLMDVGSNDENHESLQSSEIN